MSSAIFDLPTTGHVYLSTQLPLSSLFLFTIDIAHLHDKQGISQMVYWHQLTSSIAQIKVCNTSIQSTNDHQGLFLAATASCRGKRYSSFNQERSVRV